MPHETRVVNLRESTGVAARPLPDLGGISLEHSGPKGALMARVLIQEAATGYSAVAELSDQRTCSNRVKGRRIVRSCLPFGHPIELINAPVPGRQYQPVLPRCKIFRMHPDHYSLVKDLVNKGNNFLAIANRNGRCIHDHQRGHHDSDKSIARKNCR